jgi:two-component system nitrate/nitrite sensor histidine kinase NarQ
VTATDGTHSVNIRDNGIGIGEASEPPGHYGLNIMRERAGTAGRTLHFSAAEWRNAGQRNIQNADEPGG